MRFYGMSLYWVVAIIFAWTLQDNPRGDAAFPLKGGSPVGPVLGSSPESPLKNDIVEPTTRKLSSVEPVRHDDATQKKAKPPPLPPAKLYDAIAHELLEDRLSESLGVTLRIDEKLGIGGFGLVYKGNLTAIEVPSARGDNVDEGASILYSAGESVLERLSSSADDLDYAVAIKFFKKPKAVDFLRELHFHNRIEQYVEEHELPKVWDYFPKILFSSSVKVDFQPDELDMDAVSTFSDSEQAVLWTPSEMPPLFFHSTIIYEYLQYTLHDFKGLIEPSPFFHVYERVIFYKVLDAISFLADMNIIHKDLKPKNIMIDFKDGFTLERSFSSDDEAYTVLMHYLLVKVIDFGLSLDRSSEEFGKGGGKTREYESPENIVRLPKTSLSFDTWSVGILMLEWYLDGPFFTRRDNALNLPFIHFYIEPLDDDDWPTWRKGRFWDRHAEKLHGSLDAFTPAERNTLNRLHQKWEEALTKMDPWTEHLVLCMLRVRPSYRISAAQAKGHPYFAAALRHPTTVYTTSSASFLEDGYGDLSYSEPESTESSTDDVHEYVPRDNPLNNTDDLNQGTHRSDPDSILLGKSEL